MVIKMNIEPTHPELLAPHERAREAAQILADAIARIHANKAKNSKILLGFSPAESVHANPSTQGDL